MKKTIFGIGLVLAFVAALTGCSKKSSAAVSSAEKKTLTFSKSQGPYSELFEDAIIPILEKQGYKVNAVDFSDLLTADIALNDGSVDFNVEQHTAYLENFNANYNGDLVPVSPIPTVPAGIYSVNHKSLSEVKEGAHIAVPNDASNTARAYLLLQKLGWIKLDSKINPTNVTQDDIIENPKNLVFTEQKSLTIPAAIQDFDYVVITGSVVYNAGIDASTALATEDILPHLILQVTVKNSNKDAQWSKDIAAAYHSKEFKEYLAENNKDLWWIPEELR